MTNYNVSTKEIFNTAKAFFATLDREMIDTAQKALYQDGTKDSYVKAVLNPLTKATADKILELKPLSEEIGRSGSNAARELDLVISMYYELVTTAFDLGKVRTSDLVSGDDLEDVINKIILQLDQLRDLEELDPLREELEQRGTWYESKPVLRQKVRESGLKLSQFYIINPSKPKADYTNGDVLAEIKGLTVTSASTSALPTGLELNTTTGEIFVNDTEVLVAGEYSITLKTADQLGGASDVTIDFAIGVDFGLEYELTEPRFTDAYAVNDVLASLNQVTGQIIRAEVIGGFLPPGVTLLSDGDLVIGRTDVLVPGNWVVQIQVTKVDTTTSDHTLALSFLQDREATAAAAAALPLDEYAYGTLIAAIRDEDGQIVTAEVTGLPNGVALNATTGALTVNDKNALDPGTHTVNITTVSPGEGTKYHVVQLVIEPDLGTPATYNYTAPKALASYAAGDTLATVNDPMGQVIRAFVLSGNLPDGVKLNLQTGTLSVETANDLVGGNYTFKVSTINVAAVETKHDVILQIGTAAYYVANPSKPLDHYKTDDILAVPVLPSGAVASASVPAGVTLPGGMVLDAATGEIKVSLPTDLTAATSTFNISLTDVGGTGYTAQADITIDAASAVTYQYAAPKVASTYVNGDVLAWLTNTGLDIISAKLVQGILPLGLSLNDITGEVFVSDNTLLFPGQYTGSIVEITDLFGGSVQVNLSLEMLWASEVIFSVIDKQPVNQLNNGDQIIWPSSGAGVLVAAQLTGGPLPRGTSLNMQTGEVLVIDNQIIRDGTFPVSLRSTDTDGNVNDHNLTIVLEAADSAASYTIETPKTINLYTAGEVVAYPTDPDGTIVSAVLLAGTLVPGLNFNTSNGGFSIGVPESLIAGKFLYKVQLTDNQGNVTVTGTFEIEFLGISDSPSDYAYETPKFQDQYSDGERIAYPQDSDGAIIAANLLSGTLGNGITYSTANGEISVQTANSLVPGTYKPVIELTDVLNNKTTVGASYTIHGTAPVYGSDNSKPASDYVDDETIVSVVYSGSITNAKISTGGSFPEGVSLDSNGRIYVSDQSRLQPADWSGTIVLVTDVGVNAIVPTNFSIQTSGSFDYQVNPVKFYDEYKSGDIIARFLGDFNSLSDWSVTMGGMPPGMRDNNGDIEVGSAGGLVPGIYTLDVTVEDNNSNLFVIELTLFVGRPKSAPGYITFQNFTLTELRADTIVAQPSVSNFIVNKAVLTSGVVPNGLSFNTQTGVIQVSNLAQLKSNSYSFGVRLTSTTGGNLSLDFNVSY